MKRGTYWFVAPVLVILSTSTAVAQITAGPADDVEAIIEGLNPGDELVLEDGVYPQTGRFDFDIAGTEGAPIVIRAAPGATPHFRRSDDSQNVWDFSAEHVVIRGIELSGGSAGLRIQGADSVTIEACHIHDTGDVAIRMNDSGVTYDSVRIMRNHIHHTNGTGEGMYLGCNRDDCRLMNSVIEGNYVHHTNQAGVVQGDGIELKEGSAGNVIRDNVIHDTNYPCILTYGVVGNGSANVIERNAMWRCGDHAIQSAADAIIRNNVILGADGAGIAMQPHQNAAPSNLEVVHNTVLQPVGNTISLRGMTGTVLIANNALYAQSGSALVVSGGSSMLTVVGNVGIGDVGGVSEISMGDSSADLVMAHFGGAPPMDVFPTELGNLLGGGSEAHVVADDFNGDDRHGLADVGAYAYAATGNLGWVLSESFKRAGTVSTTPPDGGIEGGLDGGADSATDSGTADSAADSGTAAGADGARVEVDAASSEPGPTDAGCSVGNGSTAPQLLGPLLLLMVARCRRRRYK